MPATKRKLETTPKRRSKYPSYPKRKLPRVETPEAFTEVKAEGKVPDHGLSTTQLCHALEWFLREEWTRRSWWQVKEGLQAETGEMTAAQVQEFSSHDEAVEELRRRARDLVIRGQLHLGKQESKSSDLLWARKMVKEGTLRDRFTALEVLVENCPVVRGSDVRRLFASSAKHNRTEKLGCVNHCRNLLCSKFLLPNDRALQPLEAQASNIFISTKKSGKSVKYIVQTPTKDGSALRLFLCMIFEDELRVIVEAFVHQLEALSRDSIPACRKVCIQICRDMLLTKPEQEEAILQILVKLLGDLEPKVASMASHNLAKILSVHPAMKINVAYRIEQLVWSQRVSLMAMELRDPKPTNKKETRNRRKIKDEKSAKSEFGSLSTRRAHQMVYNGVLFLSELQYSAKLDPPNLPTEMLKRFWRLLRIMLQPLDALRKKQRHFKDKLVRKCDKKRLEDRRKQRTKGEKVELMDGKKVKVESKSEREDDGDPSGSVPKSSSTPTTVNYLFGLGHTTEGSSVLRYVLTGVRRLIPYVEPKWLTNQINNSDSDDKKKADIPSTATDQMEELSLPPPTKSDTIVSQLFNLCHNVSSWATRVHGWDLLYMLMKHSGGVTSTYLGNLSSQLRDPNFLESRARNLMIRLVMKIAGDAESVDLTSRVALLRRLLSIVVLSDDQPAMGSKVFDMLVRLFEEDKEILNWWKMDMDEEVAALRYDSTAYNISQSRAENSPPWESAHLASCLKLETARKDKSDSRRDSFSDQATSSDIDESLLSDESISSDDDENPFGDDDAMNEQASDGQLSDDSSDKP